MNRLISNFKRYIYYKIKQNHYIKNYNFNAKNIIVFIVPNANNISGGMISISSIYEETQKLNKIHNSEVLACTSISQNKTVFRYTMFKNKMKIFRFIQIISLFKKIETILIHIPEYMVENFYNKDLKLIYKWLKKINNIHINILNQHVESMPSIETINNLKLYCNRLTNTTAHESYSNQEHRDKFGIPLHHLSACCSYDNYFFKKYEKKENVILVSPDKNKYKDKILKKIKTELATFKIIIIQNLLWSEYKKIISNAKFCITFGEGFDGYLIEPIFSGSISFGVYNKNFFTDDYKNFPTVYKNYDDMYENICTDIKKYDNINKYTLDNQIMYDCLKKMYSFEIYQSKVKNFYLNNLDFK